MNKILISISVLALLSLTACGLTQASLGNQPDQLGSLLKDVKTVNLNIDVSKATWLERTGLTDPKLIAKCVADLRDPSDQRFQMEATVSGKTAGSEISVSGEVIGVGNYAFLHLTNVGLPNISLPGLLISDQWYRLANPIAGDSNRIIGVKDWVDLSASQMTQLRALVGRIDWLRTESDLPDEIVNGDLSTHWQLKVDKPLLKIWLERAVDITGQPISIDRVVDDIFNSRLELWQSRRGQHRPTRLMIDSEQLKVSVDFTHWDTATHIVAPSKSVFDLDWSKLMPALPQI